MTDTIAQKIAVRGLHVVVGVLVAATPWAVSCSGQTPLPPDPPSVNPGGGDPWRDPDRGRRLRHRLSRARIRRQSWLHRHRPPRHRRWPRCRRLRCRRLRCRRANLRRHNEIHLESSFGRRCSHRRDAGGSGVWWRWSAAGLLSAADHVGPLGAHAARTARRGDLGSGRDTARIRPGTATDRARCAGRRANDTAHDDDRTAFPFAGAGTALALADTIPDGRFRRWLTTAVVRPRNFTGGSASSACLSRRPPSSLRYACTSDWCPPAGSTPTSGSTPTQLDSLPATT